MRGILAGGAIFAVVAAVVGCSKNSCSPAAPCGGNLVGTWKIASACSSGTITQAQGTGCTQTADVDSVSASGLMTYNADGTYSLQLAASVSETVTLSSGCLSGGPTTATCQGMDESVSDSAGTLTESCTSTGAGCDCNVSITVPSTSETGTYTISGNTVTMTGGDNETDDYCVSGDTLTLNRSSTDAGGLVFGDLIATKQ